ncbi:MAG: DUF502 domain-containing protein [Deltaproteobacteria bacterium]|nr:DUF502 domain-containing protein [Deltaproteobacteria bacterium]
MKKKTRKLIRDYFVTGLLIVIPFYLAVYVLSLIVGAMDSLLNYLPEASRPETYLGFKIPGLGVIFTVVLIFGVGLVAKNFLGNKLVGLSEWIIERMPIMNSIYKGSKQFLETFFSKESTGFQKVVLVEYPRKGMYGMGFVTGKAKGEVQYKTKEDTVNVFIPTTPNPTSGFYFAVPEREIIELDMSVEDAFKLVISGGMVVPPYDPLHPPVRKKADDDDDDDDEEKGNAAADTVKKDK